jgi:hypothetical protein
MRTVDRNSAGLMTSSSQTKTIAGYVWCKPTRMHARTTSALSALEHAQDGVSLCPCALTEIRAPPPSHDFGAASGFQAFLNGPATATCCIALPFTGGSDHHRPKGPNSTWRRIFGAQADSDVPRPRPCPRPRSGSRRRALPSSAGEPSMRTQVQFCQPRTASL